jgi:L-threonylcarbamoyladenylate synthase
MQVLPDNEQGLLSAIAALTRGEAIGMPTETVYGLAARYRDTAAVAAIFAAKQRPLFDPLILHVAPCTGADALEAQGVVRLSEGLRPVVDALIRRFWPGPLTLVLPRDPSVPDLVTSGLDTVAVRAPAHPVAQRLIAGAGPLVAPSANRFGRISPTCAADVVAELDGRVTYVVDGGPCTIGLESTIVAPTEDGRLLLLRPGGLALETLGQVVEPGRAGPGVAAPGQLPSHYAPRKPLTLLNSRVRRVEDLTEVAAGCWGLLLLHRPTPSLLTHLRRERPDVVVILSPGTTGAPEDPEPDDHRVARHLFGALRALDASEVDGLLVEAAPDEGGLWPAIRDRLRRAAHRD